MNLGFTVGGYALAALLGWLLLEAREDIGSIREECNTRAATRVAEAEKLARETLGAAHQRELEQRDRLIRDARNALEIASQAALEATNDASEANVIIKRLTEAAKESDNASIEQVCLLTPVPADITNSLRD